MAYSIAFCETILAPVTPSNTARAGAIINPIVQAIARSFNPLLKMERKIK
ncbi:hypothetical protein FU701_05590 [Campylobacter jejuni]|nr:hypothetical protein [Campylobacter jejuni]ECP9272830.1 hypothetical protein [Campylobacter jejuni]